ncbi:MAG: hypothetical protein AAGA99_16495 [Actinomycetota bacterium]
MILMPWRETLRRLPQVLGGLVLFGVGIALMLRAELGLAPWDVLHQGIADRTGLPVGTVIILAGVVILLGFIPLRERIGLGTVLNTIVIGLSVDATMAVLDPIEPVAVRIAAMLAGPVAMGVGAAVYIGAGLGPGPRDGLMTGFARRGPAIWKVRTAIELVVLVSGIALGGTVGVGTIWFAVSIGPFIQLTMPHVTIDEPVAEAA